jgi:hypothetical protein
MKKTNAFVSAIVLAFSFAAAAAHADPSGGNNGNNGSSGSLYGYVGSLNQTTSSFSGGSTQASSNGSNLGAAGSESTLNTTGTATTTGQFTNNGIVSTSQFQSDTVAQTFGLAPTGNGFAQSSASGGSKGSALSTGTLTTVTAGLTTSGDFNKNLGLGLGSTGFQNTGAGFGH